MKDRNNNSFASRAIISSIGGNAVDSTIFVLIAFSLVIPKAEILPMIILNVIVKTGYELLLLPATSFIEHKIRVYELKK